MTTVDAVQVGVAPGDLEKALSDLLRERLQVAGAESVAVQPDADHEGTPILAVEVKHHLVDRPIELNEVIAADRAARDLAWQMGERRFLHVEHVYDEKQQVARSR